MTSLKRQFVTSEFVRFLRETVYRHRKFQVRTEAALFTCGLALLAVYGGSRWYNGSQAKSAIDKFTAASAAYSAIQQGSEAIDGSAEIDFSRWDAQRVESYKESLRRELDAPLAILEIPKARLQAPVFRGAEGETLNRGLGWILGTARPGERGNIGIAGHRDSFFRGLKDVRVGDAIELKTLGHSDRYVVDRIQIVLPRQVSVLRGRAVPSLTLVTCYPFYVVGRAPKRYVVSASLLEPRNDQQFSQRQFSAKNPNQKEKPMKNTKSNSRLPIRLGASALLWAMVVAGAWAQDTSSTTVKHGPSSYETKVSNAEVVYVEGNDLVLRVESGRLEHLVVPDSDRFTIDGKEVSVRDLTPGTKLTQTIITSTTPRYVTTVRTIKGKVWHVNAPTNLIVSLPDGTNQTFQVPGHAKFTIEGQTKTVFDLKKGMDIEATVISDSAETVMSHNKSVVGQAPVLTPPEIGALLILPSPPATGATAASGEPPEASGKLPDTASLFPLSGLLGALAVTVSLGLATARRAVAVR